MNKWSLLKLQLIAWFSSSLIACNTVKITDTTWCADLGKYGSHCTSTLTHKDFDMTKDAWDKGRVGWLCTDFDDFSETQNEIAQLCNETSNTGLFGSPICEYQTYSKIMGFLERLKELHRKAH